MLKQAHSDKFVVECPSAVSVQRPLPSAQNPGKSVGRFVGARVVKVGIMVGDAAIVYEILPFHTRGA